MSRLASSFALIPLGLCAAAATADPVDIVTFANASGQNVTAPHALYNALVEDGTITSPLTDGNVASTGAPEFNAVLAYLFTGPSNIAPGQGLTIDTSGLDPVDDPGTPGDPGSVLETLRPTMPQVDPTITTASTFVGGEGTFEQVVVPLPGAGALAAVGLAGLMVRPRRK